MEHARHVCGLAGTIIRISIGCCGLAFAVACASNHEATPASSMSAAARGKALADASCAECHGVSPGETISPNAAAPAFTELANRSDMSRTALAVLLRTPHKSMPNFIVESGDVDDLSAYLRTLQRPQGQI